MDSNETIFYPQDEMGSLLIPVTSGCPYNRCAFCSMYCGVLYRPVLQSAIEEQLRYGDRYTERVFLTGADPLALGFEAIQRILTLVRKHLPHCACVASYASIRSIALYSEKELAVLHDAGLRLLYIGFESGLDDILYEMNKGHTRLQAIEQAHKLNRARLQFCTILVYGIAGCGRGSENASASASLVNAFETKKVITMNLRVFSGTELEKRVSAGMFAPADRQERLEELIALLEQLHPRRPVIFDTTHPTNIVKVKGELPAERSRLIDEIKQNVALLRGGGIV